nr:3-oxoacyl-ACP synthase [Raoultella sp. NCTC 9187]
MIGFLIAALLVPLMKSRRHTDITGEFIMGVSAKRIVVTGMGIVSPLGCGVQHVWQSLLAGKSGITKLSEQMVEDIPCKVAGQVPSIECDPLHGFDPLATIPAKERKKMDRFIEFALVARA